VFVELPQRSAKVGSFRLLLESSQPCSFGEHAEMLNVYIANDISNECKINIELYANQL
jgi:hypothetical protein